VIAFALVTFSGGGKAFFTASQYMAIPSAWVERIVSVRVVAVPMRDPVVLRSVA
jgi:hypothetical protein